MKKSQSQPRKESLRIAKKITTGMATWRFIFMFVLLFIAWACWNHFTPVKYHFDPYPFILFNLFLSFIAAVQGSVIMIYQSYQDEKRDDLLHNINKNTEAVLRLEKKLDKRLTQETKDA